MKPSFEYKPALNKTENAEGFEAYMKWDTKNVYAIGWADTELGASKLIKWYRDTYGY